MHLKLDLSALIDLQSFWSEGELNLNTIGERLVQYLSLFSRLLSHCSERKRFFLNSFALQDFAIPNKFESVQLLYLCQNERVSCDNTGIPNPRLKNGWEGVD